MCGFNAKSYQFDTHFWNKNVAQFTVNYILDISQCENTDHANAIFRRATGSSAASPKSWGKYLDFQRATLFCLGQRLSNHTTTRIAKHFVGSWPPLPPLATPIPAGDLLGPCKRPGARGHHVGDPCCTLSTKCFPSCSKLAAIFKYGLITNSSSQSVFLRFIMTCAIWKEERRGFLLAVIYERWMEGVLLFAEVFVLLLKKLRRLILINTMFVF